MSVKATNLNWWSGPQIGLRKAILLIPGLLLTLLMTPAKAQTINFSLKSLNFNGFTSIDGGTAVDFGPDGRLYATEVDGDIKIYTIQKNGGTGDYVVTAAETITLVKSIPNHDDDDGGPGGPNNRQVTGIVVVGTAQNPVMYVSSSDKRVGAGGGGGDVNLDTNSGVITRLTWNGSQWVAVDIVRGLPRSEENHATNGMEFRNINGTDYLIVCSGGFTNAGAPSNNFAYITEYALSGAVLSVNLTQLQSLPILIDPASGRQYIYDLPTLDDPTRPNANGINDPNAPGYNGVDVNDPWGGNDGLNQGKLVAGGPVQMFSAGYRNTYDLEITQSGGVYVTDNGANGGWGGYPFGEATPNVDNRYRPGEPGSSSFDTPNNEPQVNNSDHLNVVTTNIQNYVFGSVYGGHPCPTRANPNAGLYTRGTHTSDPGDTDADGFTDGFFRTVKYNPNGTGDAANPNRALPADWPPVDPSLFDVREADYRQPAFGNSNPDGDDDIIIVNWGNNTNAIDEYTASNFGGQMKGNLIAGKSGGSLHRVILTGDGTTATVEQDKFSTGGGNPLGLVCQGDLSAKHKFPGTIWIATFNSEIKILEPNDFTICIAENNPTFNPSADYDFDGFTNEDEIDNETDFCNGGSIPSDYDGDKISDLNDPDDDNDGIADALDPFQIGSPSENPATPFNLPIINELFSDNLGFSVGFRGLGLTGLMNNGNTGANYLDWLDDPNALSDADDINDIYGGAIGAVTIYPTTGSALGAQNNQEKAFQFGANVSTATGPFTASFRMFPPFWNWTPQDEQGFFIGTGDQDNYIKMVLNGNGSGGALVKIVSENNGVVSNGPSIPITIPAFGLDNIDFFFEINPSTGTITGQYAINTQNRVTVGSVNASSNVLSALQNINTPLAVGIISTTGMADNSQRKDGNGVLSPALNFSFNFDFIKVEGSAPYVLNMPNDAMLNPNGEATTYDLSGIFGDNKGFANLTLSLEGNTNPDLVNAVLIGNILSLSYNIGGGLENGAAVITLRATDSDGFFVELPFNASLINEPVPIYRVNAGDVQITATDEGPDWAANATTGAFTGTGFIVNTGNISTHNIVGRDASVPAYVPQSIFAKERWDPPAAPEMQWSFDVSPGNYEVRLYMGNGFSGTSAVGQRVFDIKIEGQLVENDLDLVTAFGHQVGGMKSYQVNVTDQSLDILFEHVVENPTVNGIEILSLSGGNIVYPPLALNIPNQVGFQGGSANLTVAAQGGNPNESFSYSATGLPNGLSINPSTGLISGTFQQSGNFTPSVTASKPASSPITVLFNWTVNEAIASGEILYRVNAGGATITDATKNWEADQSNGGANNTAVNGTPSPYLQLNGITGEDLTYGVNLATLAPAFVNNTGYPNALFAVERYNTLPVPNNMQWNFPVPNGSYLVKLLFAEIWTGAQETGIRVFDVNIEGQTVLNDLDQTAKYGWNTAAVETFTVTVTDGNLDIDFIQIVQNPVIKGIEISSIDDLPPPVIPYTWTSLPESENYTSRHECSFVQAGNKFFLIGGRENPKTPDIYDYTTNTWTTGAQAPIELNHYQAVEYQGLIWAIGAFQNNSYPNEAPATHVYMYDPANNVWIQGAEIPANRRRGSAGLVVHNDKFYVVGGNTIGHNGGYVNWFDVFDPLTGTWTVLPNAPRARDHFHAAVIDGKLYAAGGRLSGGPGGVFAPLVPEVDVYDFATQSWSQVAQLPTPRAAAMVANFQNKLFVIGGETESTSALTLPKTESFNPGTGTWQTEANLNHPRHGTQAIVSGNGIFVAAGSPNKGGGSQKNMEVFGLNNPTGTALVASSLLAPANVDIAPGATAPVEISVNGGNTGIFIKSMNITGPNAGLYQLTGGNLVNGFIKPNTAHNVQIQFNGTQAGQTAALVVNYGTSGVEIIYLNDPNGGGPGNPPLVSNPGIQVNLEGDIVNLPIVASDPDVGQTLSYSATNLPPSLSIDANTGVISGTLDEAIGNGVNGAFIEENGRVIMQIESAPLTNGWAQGTDGSITYYQATSDNVSNPAGGGILNYNIQITTPGVYRFLWRSKINQGSSNTDSNDNWLKLPNDANVWFFGYQGSVSSEQQLINALQGSQANVVFPKGSSRITAATTPEGAGASGFFKIYINSLSSWVWASSTSDNDPHQIYVWFVNPGTYTLQVSNRSAGHAIEKMALYKIGTYGNSYSTTTLTNAPESPRVTGESAGSAGIYDVTVTATDNGIVPQSASQTFTWLVNDELVSGDPAAQVQVTPGGALSVSTFGNNSFVINNTGTVDIVQVKINTQTGWMPDVVFDPVGTAGDNAAKCVTTGSQASAAAVGLTIPGNGGSDVENCVTPFSEPHNGVDNQEGFDVLTLTFTDFNPGEIYAFGVDMDPTTIKGDLTAGDAGAISGFELVGATVTVTFANGTQYTTSLFDEGSLGGSDAVLDEGIPVPAPTITVDGTNNSRQVNTLNQIITIQGTPNASVTLLQADARLYIDPGNPNIGYDIDPFEANEAMAKVLHNVTLNGSGLANVPVNLLQTAGASGTPNGGLNHFIAVVNGPNGLNSLASNVIVLQYNPNLPDPASLTLNVSLQARTDYSGTYQVEVFQAGNLSTPVVNTSLTANANGTMTLDNLTEGSYVVRVRFPGHLQRVLALSLNEGNNTATFAELKAGDINGDNVVDNADYELLKPIFFLTTGANGFNPAADFDGNGVLNLNDFNYLKTNFQTSGEPLAN
ncbi:MAG: hypothetical protein OHK0053_18310 [Microscillaceae bacterium]